MEPTIVGATVVQRAGKVLLVREGKPAVAGSWNLPGGRMEPGEDPTACARREAREETGLAIEPASLVGIYQDRSQVVENAVLVFVFGAHSTTGEPRPDDGDSVIEARWVSPGRLDEIDVRERYVRPAIEDAMAGATVSLSLLQDLRS